MSFVPPDLPSEEFRRFGHQVVDWIAEYLAGVRQYPVLPDIQPGDLTDRLPSSAPVHGEPMECILADFDKLILPAITHWNHPRFMAYFANTGSGPGILGEMLCAALNVNGMVWKSSPAATELEEVTLSWLRQWLGLPPDFFGIIHDTASVSTMHAIAAAREMADPGARLKGGSRDLTLYASTQAHSSVEKGAIAIGIGQENVRGIPVDDEFRMRADVLAETMERDRAAGKRPFCIVATVGTTSTTSIDPVAAIADIAAAHRAWLHVDAAYAGGAAVAPEYRHVLAGAERADSLVMNPHKWLFTPMDLSAFYTRWPDVLRRAFSLAREYLYTAENPRAINYMDYGVPLGRRFRALKLWFVMRHLGHEGAAAIVREHIRVAQELRGWIEADQRFELCAPTPFSTVCFRLKGSDEPNHLLLDRLNSSGNAFLSHTTLRGRMVLRLAIGNQRTNEEDVRLTWRLLQEYAPVDGES